MNLHWLHHHVVMNATHAPNSINNDAPSNSLRDPNAGSEMKQWKKKGVEAHSLARNTFGAGGCVRTLGWN
jgi:hypothetical protein